MEGDGAPPIGSRRFRHTCRDYFAQSNWWHEAHRTFPRAHQSFREIVHHSYCNALPPRNRRSYFYGDKAQALEICVWTRAFVAEYANSNRQAAEVWLLDLAKAYDRLQAKAMRASFSMPLLRFLLGLRYAAHRPGPQGCNSARASAQVGRTWMFLR